MHSSSLRSWFTFGAAGVLGALCAACAGGHSDARAGAPLVRRRATVDDSDQNPRPRHRPRRPRQPSVRCAVGNAGLRRRRPLRGCACAKLAANPTMSSTPSRRCCVLPTSRWVNPRDAITERWVPQPKQYVPRRRLRHSRLCMPPASTSRRWPTITASTYRSPRPAPTRSPRSTRRISVVGIGTDAARACPHRVTVYGQRIAIIGATQVIDGALIPTWTATATNWRCRFGQERRTASSRRCARLAA